YVFAVAPGGYSWEKAGRVWYATCTDDTLAADVDFQGFADLTATHAQALFGDAEHAALVQAWSEVGITVGGQQGGGGDGGGAVARIAVLTSGHELRIQEGPLNAVWTTVASDVQAFALA